MQQVSRDGSNAPVRVRLCTCLAHSSNTRSIENETKIYIKINGGREREESDEERRSQHPVDFEIQSTNYRFKVGDRGSWKNG